MAGAPHHTVLSKAIDIEVLEDFAEMTRTEFVVINADAARDRSVARFRWNAACPATQALNGVLLGCGAGRAGQETADERHVAK